MPNFELTISVLEVHMQDTKLFELFNPGIPALAKHVIRDLASSIRTYMQVWYCNPRITSDPDQSSTNPKIGDPPGIPGLTCLLFTIEPY